MAKQGRNELCACGSGKKFKKCCLAGPDLDHTIDIDDLDDREAALVRQFGKDMVITLELPHHTMVLNVVDDNEWISNNGIPINDNVEKILTGMGCPALGTEDGVYMPILFELLISQDQILQDGGMTQEGFGRILATAMTYLKNWLPSLRKLTLSESNGHIIQIMSQW